MSQPLPMPDVEFELVLETAGMHITMHSASLLQRYRRSRQLGDDLLAAAWVLSDILTSLEKEIAKQSAI